MSDQYIPAFRIKRIKQFSFSTNESLAIADKIVIIQFQHNTNFHGESNIVDLNLRVFFSYDTKIPPDTILVDFHVQNLFEVPDLKKYQIENFEYILPKNLIVAMVGISISHLRALLTFNLAGTTYQENIIPIVDPIEVSKAFYPNMFNIADSERNMKLTTLNLENATGDLRKTVDKISDTDNKKRRKKTELNK
jgi:hypothetical protein